MSEPVYSVPVTYDGEHVTVFDSSGEFAGEAVLRDQSHVVAPQVRVGPRVERVPGHEVVDVKIRFLGFASKDLQDAAEEMANRRRVVAPTVELVLDDGTRLAGCVVAGFFGGRLGERWYGIDLGERVEVSQSA